MKMTKLISMKKFLVAVSILMIFGSCEIPEESGYGNYIIGISNSTPKNFLLEVYLDGVFSGSFVVKASQQGNYTHLCGDLVYAANLDNVFILTLVSSGQHTVELKYSPSKAEAYTGHFKMTADGCISQELDL